MTQQSPSIPRTFLRFRWWLWWALALGLLWSNGSTVWDGLRSFELTAADYSTFFVAGKLLDAGRVRELYDLGAQAGMHLNAHYWRVPLPYIHPPYEAVLFAPLAQLPYLASYTAWNLCGVAMLAWMVWRLYPRLDALKEVSSLFLFVLALAFWPNVMVLQQGQDSILVAALVTEAYLQLKQGREERAGLLLALCLFKFQLVLPLVACFALNRQWRLVKSFALVAAGLVAISFAMIGRSGIARYLKLLASLHHLPLSAYANPGPMPNLRGLAVYWLESAPNLVLPAVFVASLIVFAAVVRLLPGEERGERFNLFFSCATMVSYLLSYHGYEHDMAMMFPGLLLAANSVTKRDVMRQDRQPWKVACFAIVGVLFCSPLYPYLFFHRMLSLMCLPILLLVALLSFAPREQVLMRRAE
jgi:hypothetical protein